MPRHPVKSTVLTCLKCCLSDMEMGILRDELFDDAKDHQVQDARWRDLVKMIKHKVAQKVFIVHAFVIHRDLRILRGLLKILPDLMNSNDERGLKPLSLAAYEGYLEGVSFFLTKFPKYAQICDEDGSGSFPIHRAVMRGHVGVVAELLSRCPGTIDQTNSKHQTILHLAALNPQTDVLRYLKKHQRKLEKILDSRDAYGNTFRDYLERREGHE